MSSIVDIVSLDVARSTLPRLKTAHKGNLRLPPSVVVYSLPANIYVVSITPVPLRMSAEVSHSFVLSFKAL